METFSFLLALCAGNSPITGEFPSQRPVTRSFDVFFDMCLDNRWSKQSRGWWFEMPSHLLWRNCIESSRYIYTIPWHCRYYSLLISRVKTRISTLHIVNIMAADACHFAHDIFKWIFLNENAWILLKISLKFVPKVGINNIPALVQIMACRRPGGKPLSEPMMVSLLTHICVTPPQWV